MTSKPLSDMQKLLKIGRDTPRSASMSTDPAAALLRLGNWDEAVIDGVVWTRQDDEFKVSPYGLQGDYDRGCYWVPRKGIREHFRA